MLRKRFGFTLAEVLITLGIIGVVAAMTIPTLMMNIQNNEFKTKMKKEYSLLSNAYQLLKTDSGGDFPSSLASLNCADGDSNCLKNVLKQKISTIRECNVGSKSGICFPASANIKFLSGSAGDDNFIGDTYTSGLILKDGAALNFYLESASCSASSPNYSNRCGWITVDVNGLQNPNVWGRDIYLFFMFSNAIRPAAVGVIDTWAASADDCGVGANLGYTCASKYLLGN